MTEAELANSGGVDQLTATREVVEARGRGGVGALTGPLGQIAYPGLHLRQQAIDQRRLADPGLADEHTDVSVQLLLQLLHAITVMGRNLQQRIAQLPVHRQQGIERRGVLLVDQVGLVQQQQRTNAGVFGGYQVAVDQVGVGFWCRGEDDNDQVDVGRYRLELATTVGSAQFGMARHLRDDDTDTLVA
ncbi:hypothetical protein D3C80_414800 [compost metagenome]